MPRRLLMTLALVFAATNIAHAGDAEDLQSPDAKTRLLAARRLGKWQAKIDPALTPLLVDRLREDPDPQVRLAVAYALGNLTPPQRYALAALAEVARDTDEPVGVRHVAIGTLAKLGKGSKRAADVFAGLAEDPAVTDPAVKALVAVGAEDRAKTFLAHKDPKIRELANGAYLKSGGTEVLAIALGGSDQATRRKAAEGVANRDYFQFPLKAEEIATIAKYAADSDAAVRLDIILGLTRAKQTSHIIPALVDGLRSDSERLVYVSAAGLAIAGPGVAKHLPEITTAADKAPPGPLKRQLLLALGEAGAEAKPALPALFAALKEKNDETREGAALALIKAGAADPAEVVKRVRPLTSDQYADAREAANKVIQAWAKPDTSDVTRLLRDRDHDTRMKGLALVRKLGPDAEAAIPDLFAVAARVPKDNDGDEVTEIGVALAAIGAKAVPAIVEKMKAGAVPTRQVCATALEKLRLDAAEALPALRQGVLDVNLGVRFSCAQALSHLGYRARAAVPNLIESLTKFEDSSMQMAEALCWIGAAGDDAKKLLELAKSAPAKPLARRARFFALGGVGKDLLSSVEEFHKGLPATDQLRGVVEEAIGYIDRERVAAHSVGRLKDPTEPGPHEAARNALKFDLTAEQKKQLAAGIAATIGTRPPPIQTELLRCLGWLGADAADAAPAVEKLAGSPDESVRRQAKLTAARISK